jgi:hypothetical protein
VEVPGDEADAALAVLADWRRSGTAPQAALTLRRVLLSR